MTPVDFRVTDHTTEWVKDFSADIGGVDGYYPVCEIVSAIIETAEGDLIPADRDELLTAFGHKAVQNQEEELERNQE